MFSRPFRLARFPRSVSLSQPVSQLSFSRIQTPAPSFSLNRQERLTHSQSKNDTSKIEQALMTPFVAIGSAVGTCTSYFYSSPSLCSQRAVFLLTLYSYTAEAEEEENEEESGIFASFLSYFRGRMLAERGLTLTLYSLHTPHRSGKRQTSFTSLNDSSIPSLPRPADHDPVTRPDIVVSSEHSKDVEAYNLKITQGVQKNENVRSQHSELVQTPEVLFRCQLFSLIPPLPLFLSHLPSLLLPPHFPVPTRNQIR